ncbi:hypothetical protein C5Y96_22050 [Blastopirellula marina]|uniref:THUMP-like domain-containing protein n=1 Tax=Blastopirellula marina TaxID=124 RepID=A0A2S8F1W4_9BACT|nr:MULTISPECIES: class I SAM-dependent methyltransferase [Pirellulaceae]PQO26133.1 hypothetical protein C5Y96_22050 [Blastopirellula marina]RCS44492.1 class I SAM-dependent methyltransferase [Bremerella cremea]
MPSPDQSESLTTCQWLVSGDARSWFDWLSGVDVNAIGTLTRLRQELGSDRSAALLTQAELRKRAARKFAQAESMFFTDIGLQQSTDQEIAAYKAQRFPVDQPLADLCCGIGGDLIALAQRGPTTAVDASSDHLCFAEANVSAGGAKLADTRCGLAEETPLEQFAAWHIDPDRRHDDRRTIRLGSFSPSLADLEAMLRRNRNAALKLAPASRLPEAWEAEGQCEWISHHRECKQLVAWLGKLAQKPSTRRATRIDQAGKVDFFEGTPRSLVSSTEIGSYLFDPDPSLVAAGLVDTLAEAFGLARLSPDSHYLTGNQAIDHPLLQPFEIISQEKVDAKRLKKAVAEAQWGTLELKQRGLELKLEVMRKQLKPRGKGEGTIVFTPTVAGNRAILCRRTSS